MSCSSDKKAFLIIAVLCLAGLFSRGQKHEINLNAYTGSFSFHGNGSASTSWINYTPYTSPHTYTSNVYGKKGSFSYSFELQAQKVTKKKDIYGLALSFEVLPSTVKIDTVTADGFIYNKYPATGKTTLKNTFITLSPLAGHRYMTGKIVFDLTAGCDLAFCLRSHEDGEAITPNDYDAIADNNKDKPSVDVRPRVQVKIQYEKFGLLLGYSLGLTNYPGKAGTEACSRFLRTGISYLLK